MDDLHLRGGLPQNRGCCLPEATGTLCLAGTLTLRCPVGAHIPQMHRFAGLCVLVHLRQSLDLIQESEELVQVDPGQVRLLAGDADDCSGGALGIEQDPGEGAPVRPG